MNKKWLSLIIGVAVICALMAASFVELYIATSLQPTKSMDFIVSGTNDCQRFLNNSVSIIYVPFTKVNAAHNLSNDSQIKNLPYLFIVEITFLSHT